MKWTLAIAALLLAGCNTAPSTKKKAADKPIGTPVALKAPLGLPPVPIPDDNPPTADTIALGRKLFYDPRLSVDDTVACATCHNPQLGFSDGKPHSSGVFGQFGKRNAPTVINAAYSTLQFWDGRARGLEDQAAGPIANPVEMNQKHDACAGKIGVDAEYKQLFEKAFGPGPVTIEKIQYAIASFERTVVSGDSPFDRFRYGNDPKALSPAAARGLAVFLDRNKGNCVACHTVEDKYALFTDGKFHNIGAGVNGDGDILDQGRFDETHNEADRGAFKTPTLRNIANTAPYMHDGSLRTLKQVVDFYAGQGNSNPHLDPEMKKIHLTGTDRADLVEFLNALTGSMPENIGPPAAR